MLREPLRTIHIAVRASLECVVSLAALLGAEVLFASPAPPSSMIWPVGS